MRLKAVAAASLACILPAAAGPLDATFGKNACYARSYDAAHLARHPRQTVAKLALTFAPANADGTRNAAARFELGFGFQLNGAGGWYDGNAICARKGAGFACALEGDGGSFRLTPTKGGLRLDVVNRGGTDAAGNQINVEGDDFGGFGKPGGDDLTFDLKPARGAACSSGEEY
jgi:hypothetical protein